MTNKKNILLTGGAGFIGSNLVKAFLHHPQIGLVRVIDNLSTGNTENIDNHFGHENFEFVEGDIRNFDECLAVTNDIDVICHQAALGSVPRSVENPLLTNEVNITGTLNVFHAAVEQKVNRVVFAASSSTYGDHPGLPKKEETIGSPLSPYAVTKYVNELYAQVFYKTYGLNFIGLRYFNIFGPHQSPNGAYAAVIPMFVKAAMTGQTPRIHGDGLTSRDFTYIDNAVSANLLSLFTEDPKALNQVYNIACGQQTSLTDLWNTIQDVVGVNIPAEYGPSRKGDVAHSLADIGKAKDLLGYEPRVAIKDGLQMTVDWFRSR